MSVRKRYPQSLLQKLLPTLIAAMFALVGSKISSAAEKPNVIFILMDDMGWRDVGFMGNTFIETPNLDRLAKEGLVFTSAYASAPNCAPTRACLMSGQYTPRHGIYTVVDPRQPPGSPWHKLRAADSLAELDSSITTVAESLKSGGYATAFFGMWNLGRGRTGPVTPGGQGFDKVVFPENLGFGKDEYFDGDGNYLSDRLTDSLLEFVDDNKDRPFFAYYPDHAVHAPYNPKPDLLKKYQQKMESSGNRRDNAECAATVEAVDQNVGRILQKLKELKIDQSTMIIFTSDNGGTNQYTAPLKGSKGQLYEGGIRIPLVVHWAGLKNPGRKCSVPVSSVDWFPTLVELTGAPKSSKQIQDGMSLMPIIEGGESLKRDRLFWHFPSYVGKSAPSSAVRVGDYKLIEFFEDGGTTELYNLADDPGEESNLVRSEPAKAKELYAILQNWQKETGAAIPDKANPNYDPKAERPRGGPNGAGGGNAGGGGGGKGQGGMNKGKKGRR